MNTRKTGSQTKGSTTGRKPRLPCVKISAKLADAERIVNEDWRFMDPHQCGCPGHEKPYLLEYEYAREGAAYGIQYRSFGIWQQIFGDLFPQTPFLSINPIERGNLLAGAFAGRAGKMPLFDITSPEVGLSYQYGYSLTPEFQVRLEAVAEEAREKSDLVQPQRLFDGAITEFKLRLPEEAYDKSIAHIQMTVRFDYSDNKLKEAFANMLAAIRRTEPESSGQNDLDVKLRRLAATRLYRIFGTVEKARSYAFDQGYDNLYDDDGGWSRARKEVWQTLGVSAFPPDEAE